MYKKGIWIVIIFVLSITTIFFIIDLLNLGISNITKEYDWLNYIGSLISFSGTIIVAIIAYYQNIKLQKINENLNKINKEMYEDNMKSLGFLNTDFYEKQYLYTIYDNDGFKLIPEIESIKQELFNEESVAEIKKDKKLLCSGDHNDIRFIINIIQNENKNIESFYFDDIRVDYSTNLSKSVSFVVNEKEYLSIEKEKGNKYNMTIILKAPKISIKEIEESFELRLTFNLRLKNCNDIVTSSWNEIVMRKGNENIGDRIYYALQDEDNTGRSPRTKYNKVYKLDNY